MRVITHQAGSHFPSAPLAANGAVVWAVALMHTQLIALRRVDNACRRPCSRQTAYHSPSLLSANIRAVKEICASTQHRIGPSLHPVQALKNHLWLIRGSTILDHIGTRFLGGATYTWERLTRKYIWYITFSLPTARHQNSFVCHDEEPCQHWCNSVVV